MRVVLSSLLLVTLTALPVRADLSALSSASAVAARAVIASDALQEPAVAIAFGVTRAADLVGEYGTRAVATLPAEAGQHFGAESATPSGDMGDEPASLSVPSAPGGDILCLSGLLSLGALHTLRRAGQAHFGALPSWYHAERLNQVGHVVPFEFDFVTLPACFFEQPLDPMRVHFERAWVAMLRPVSQVHIPPSQPRAPPVLL